MNYKNYNEKSTFIEKNQRLKIELVKSKKNTNANEKG